MNYTRAIDTATTNICFRRQSWDVDKKVRRAHEGDRDHLGVVNIDGVFVEDCVKPMDCNIRIWAATQEDRTAGDYEIVNCNK